MFSHEALKQFREELGMSQEQLMIEMANSGVKVSRPTISNWETGDSVPDANALVILSQVLRKSVKNFFAS